MTQLDKLIESNNLGKQKNRTNRLEKKLRKQEYYGETEELFDPLTKTLNTNNEARQPHMETMQALHNKTIAALDSNTNASNSVGYKSQNSFLDERAGLVSPTPDPSVTLKDDRGKKFAVDNDMIDIILLMVTQTNKHFELISVDPNSNKFKINRLEFNCISSS